MSFSTGYIGLDSFIYLYRTDESSITLSSQVCIVLIAEIVSTLPSQPAPSDPRCDLAIRWNSSKRKVVHVRPSFARRYRIDEFNLVSTERDCYSSHELLFGEETARTHLGSAAVWVPVSLCAIKNSACFAVIFRSSLGRLICSALDILSDWSTGWIILVFEESLSPEGFNRVLVGSIREYTPSVPEVGIMTARPRG